MLSVDFVLETYGINGYLTLKNKLDINIKRLRYARKQLMSLTVDNTSCTWRRYFLCFVTLLSLRSRELAYLHSPHTAAVPLSSD